MIWIRLYISCIAFLSVTGSILFGLIRFGQRLRFIEHCGLLSVLQKIAFVLYWIPIPFAGVYYTRISYTDGVRSYSGEFVCSTVPGMTVAFRIIGMIWLLGFLLSVVRAGIKMCRLTKLIRGNVPVQDALYLGIFEECCSHKGMFHVSLCQNDLLCSPITAGLFRKQIILPFAKYTASELWMIYEHELTHMKKGICSGGCLHL